MSAFTIRGPGYFEAEKLENQKAAARAQAQQEALGMYNAGKGAVAGGVGAAQSAYDVALGQLGANQANISAIKGSAGDVRGTAGTLMGTADRLLQMEGNLAPDAQKLRDIGGTLASEGQALFDQSRPFMEQAGQIVNLDKNATGLAGGFMDLYSKLTPEALVGFASSSMSRTIANTREQTERAMARTGIGAGSAAMAKVMANAKKHEDALISSVKTKAHMMGLDKIAEALGLGTKMAVELSGIGINMATAGTQATGAAGTAHAGAADIEAKRAGIVSQAGGLQAQAGGLHAQAGGLEAQAAQVQQTGINALVTAGGNLANAQMTAAEYYSTQASSLLGGLQQGINFGWLLGEGLVNRPGGAF